MQRKGSLRAIKHACDQCRLEGNGTSLLDLNAFCWETLRINSINKSLQGTFKSLILSLCISLAAQQLLVMYMISANPVTFADLGGI